MKQTANGTTSPDNVETQPADAKARKLSPEALAKLGEVRSKLSKVFAQVTLALLGAPRYRNQSIGDLEWLVLEPLLRDRIAIASAKPGADEMIGFAIWATVSEDVSRKIEEQVKAGSFPVRLKTNDWTSGEIVWLLDVVAPNARLATSVLMNFGQLAKSAPVHIHPMIKRLVDPEALAKLTRKPETAFPD